MNKEKITKITTASESPSIDEDIPEFDPAKAKRLREQEEREPTLRERFSVNPDDYPIFKRQEGRRYDKLLRKDVDRRLNIDETLGLMVGSTASTIAAINGEDGNNPPSDHVIYLDKSARPVSWLVDDFWDDFSDRKKPEESFLAIDRRYWFRMVGLDIDGSEYIKAENGEGKLATGSDFWRKFEELPEERKTDLLARIRALYIEGGIEEEDPAKIMATPTKLDGKNLMIIDEVSRSGATLDIAKGLLKRAIPELKHVSGHVFWSDNSTQTDSGDTQMGMTPVWYPRDKRDWRGRGVKDVNPEYYQTEYDKNPNNKTRAEKYGAIVLGEPLLRKEDEPGQLSWKLKEEMARMHQDYVDGHILPNFPGFNTQVFDKMYEKISGLGVEFIPEEEAKNNPNTYNSLAEYRNRPPEMH